MTLPTQKRPPNLRRKQFHPMKQELSTPTSTANEAVVIVAITVEEEAIAAVKAAILVVARKVTRGIRISIQTSTVPCMKDKGMMQITAAKLLAKENLKSGNPRQPYQSSC